MTAGFTDFLAPTRGGPALAKFIDITAIGLGPFFNASILLAAIMFTGAIPGWKKEMQRMQKQGREVITKQPAILNNAAPPPPPPLPPAPPGAINHLLQTLDM